MLLEMKEGILYGPVNSRRYGRSLGINLMPSRDKLCSFNCVYCHYGNTRRCTMDVARFADEMPDFDAVVEAVEGAMTSPLAFDLITFSGNGEPTLYPRFGELVEEVVRLRDKHRPAVKVALLSNSSGLVRDEVCAVVAKIDLPIFKLDAGREETFLAINRPTKEVTFSSIVRHLSSLQDIYLQTVLVDGTPSNITVEELRAYADLVAAIRPIEVHAYSIDRPVESERISLVSPERLKEIASRVEMETGVRVRAFGVGGR